MAQRFSVGQALSHWRKADAPGGFMRKFVPLFVLVFAVLTIISTAINWPFYELYGELIADMATDTEPDLIEFSERSQEFNFRTGLALLVLTPLQLGIWCIFEAALQRRYIRGEAFSLKFGDDEKRLAVIGLIWIGFFVAWYISLIFGMIIVALLAILGGMIHPVVAGILGGLGFLAYILVVTIIGVRFSAASGLTVRDRKIAFFDSWRVTRGATRSLVWSYLILGIAFTLMTLLLYAAAFGAGYASVSDAIANGDRAEIVAALSSQSMWGLTLITTLIALTLYGFFIAMFAGPGALAAKTDPSWAGQSGVVEEFS